LNGLVVENCPNLKKINCSNNYITNLDLSACAKIEEVDINNCPDLNVKEIRSALVYDTFSGKLAKSSSVIIPAQEGDVRNILIIGITGNGKSTLANALTNTNQFQEENFGVGATKSFQKSDIFE